MIPSYYSLLMKQAKTLQDKKNVDKSRNSVVS